MTCAKVQIDAILVTPSGEVFTGRNSVRNPQTVCPRVGDKYAREDYILCKTVCDQPYHAEVDALRKAGDKARGATLYVEHNRICSECRAAIRKAGVRVVFHA
jgi:deoxycytidylate deaminase